MNDILEKYVVPICDFNIDSRKIKSFFGTAFFINSQGLFLSAKHCIPQNNINNGNMGLIVKGTSQENRFSKIVNIEYAPNNLDIVIGKIDFDTHSNFRYQPQEISIWQDVATVGFPEHAINKEDGFWIYTRGLKGYVQRVILPKTLSLFPNNGSLLELSFPITVGLSGSPLFIHTSPQWSLVGICISTHSSERIVESHVDIIENGKQIKEIRFEQAGLAQDIRDILSWKPSFLDKNIGQILENNTI